MKDLSPTPHRLHSVSHLDHRMDRLEDQVDAVRVLVGKLQVKVTLYVTLVSAVAAFLGSLVAQGCSP